ncbi:MAG: 3-hydroxyacyl-CoA dehydrogenase [uncultured Corynebacteriales bacterium]|uniref:3-hydroxyacyl-CoA dehydrogenase n=1 Tax=uncultured Mycobacteriales bacterium TaxID=581187 RepID=A0A6J4HFD7_9ACTN|nr:MAG: 3-hydroxyacyl-CoA dehydrogenase [uncultured Corynebacteriales bacterium]
MSDDGRVAVVVGAGTIGLGWVVLFLAHGLTVRVVSTRGAAAEGAVRDALELFAPGLPGHPVPPARLARRLEIVPELERALDGADVVQENTPENLELKQGLFARLGAGADPRTLLLSSTSTLVPDELSARMAAPGRVVVGHPFNPPHLVPLVEVVGGTRTDPDAVAGAVRFYESVGKVPVVLRRPIMAFAANRLQSALLREAIHLVREGVVTVGELDEVVTASVGPRWATMGPFRSFHLGGGEGGLRRWLTTLGAGLQKGWQELGEPVLDDDTIELLLAQAEEAFGDIPYRDLAARRDVLLRTVLEALDRVREDDPAPL